VEENAFDDGGAKLRHAIGEPGRYTAAVQGQIRNSGTLHAFIVYGAGRYGQRAIWEQVEEPPKRRLQAGLPAPHPGERGRGRYHG
jgi:hypothetical protein